MIIDCPNCKKPIELDITNVLRQRIDLRMKELEKLGLQDPYSTAIYGVLKEIIRK